MEKYKESCDVRRGLVQGKAEETDNAESREQKSEGRSAWEGIKRSRDRVERQQVVDSRQ